MNALVWGFSTYLRLGLHLIAPHQFNLVIWSIVRSVSLNLSDVISIIISVIMSLVAIIRKSLIVGCATHLLHVRVNMYNAKQIETYAKRQCNEKRKKQSTNRSESLRKWSIVVDRCNGFLHSLSKTQLNNIKVIFFSTSSALNYAIGCIWMICLFVIGHLLNKWRLHSSLFLCLHTSTVFKPNAHYANKKLGTSNITIEAIVVCLQCYSAALACLLAICIS